MVYFREYNLFYQMCQITSSTLKNCTFSTTDNSYGHIGVIVTEITFGDDYIHISHDMSKQYMYGYLISNLICSKVATHNIMQQTIYLILIGGLGGGKYCLLVISNYYSALHKPITHWYDTAVMGILTKKCTICGVAVFTILQTTIFQLFI